MPLTEALEFKRAKDLGTKIKYIEMLLLELAGSKYNKSAFRRKLLEQLEPGRTPGSVESKRMNISAAFLDAGLPAIDGYKPFSNYQALVAEIVDDLVSRDPRVKTALDGKTVEPLLIPSVGDILTSFEQPPERAKKSTNIVGDRKPRNSPTGLNYLEIDAANSELGFAGEEFCIRFEKARLIYEGAENLADRIEHVSETVGPSAGYDIHSYNKNGSDRYIEVKTTKYGKRTPFFISPNEVRFSEEKAKDYCLYRLYKFTQEPKLFSLPGSVSGTCELSPSQLRATVR